MTTEEKVISGKYMTTRTINVEIKKALDENEKNLNIEVTKPFDSVAVGLCWDADITLAGSPGDFAGALNDGAKISIKGNTGRYVGNNMTSGEIIVEGSADDGVGFDVEKALKSRHMAGLGLINMRETAEFAGGSFTLQSAPGHGTRICVEI